ncbi:MAG TPA: DUF488 family protein [Acidimicrobiia bacterium]|nr:DUF488 family protein [Acidimicrobiia bacterium]
MDLAQRVRIKRVYEPPARGDGRRILVDRLWPRGLAKSRAEIDEWRKELAPSTELRRFYGHRPERFGEFTRRYQAELRRPEATAALADLARAAARRPVTLLTASRDLAHSDAAVLQRRLRDRVRASSRRTVRQAG